MPPFQVYLFATITGQGTSHTIRYLHGTRDTQEEAVELCDALNDRIADSEYRVVEDE